MADITSNLIVYYPFNNDRSNYATGTGVSDTTNNGTTISTVSPAVGRGSLALVGSTNSGQYLQLDSNSIVRSTNFVGTNGLTFACWFKSNNSATWARIIDWGNGVASDNIFMYINNNNLGIGVYIQSTSTQYNNTNNVNYNNNTWYHVVWTITYSNNNTSTYTVYINGTQIYRQSNNNYYPRNIARNSSFIGRSNWADPYWNGNIDEFRIYQRVLTQTDITALYNYTAPADITSDLVVYYPFDSNNLNYATGTGVSDTTNTGTTINDTIYKVGGGSLNIGVNQYLEMTNATTQSNFYTEGNGVSFALWINYTGSSGGSNPRVLDIGKANDYTNNLTLLLPGGGSLTANYSNIKQVPIGNFAGAGWKHIVWTISSSGYWTIYVNGVFLSGSQEIYPTAIGKSFIGLSNMGTSDGFVVGNIDEFRIYQRVLLQADVTALYNYTGPDPGPPTPSGDIPCFRKGTKILCLHNGKEEYLPIEKLRTGTLVKTLLHSYIPIYLIGKKQLRNPRHRERIEDRLFLCSKEKYPELLEDLYITGHHAILVQKLTEEQREKTLKIMGDIYITDNKYRLLTCLDERAEPFAEPGEYTIYHFALENDNYKWNYGVYANGLLVESCSKEHIEIYSGMEII